MPMTFSEFKVALQNHESESHCYKKGAANGNGGNGNDVGLEHKPEDQQVPRKMFQVWMERP